jgi:hypothetical protein
MMNNPAKKYFLEFDKVLAESNPICASMIKKTGKVKMMPVVTMKTRVKETKFSKDIRAEAPVGCAR